MNAFPYPAMTITGCAMLSLYAEYGKINDLCLIITDYSIIL
jgi:hypothetical protein